MMVKSDFKPGQTVYLLEVGYLKFDYRLIEKKIREVKVLSVGRKYITVDFYGKMQFDIANDFREVTNYSVNWKLFLSKEDIAQTVNRKKMEERIYTAFHFPNSITRKMTFEELQTVFDIVKRHSKF